MKKRIAFIFTVICFTVCAGVQAQETQKFAYISSDSVLVAMPEYQTQMKIYESYVKQLQGQLEAKQKELQQKFTDYQQNGANWIPEVLAEKEKEINTLDQSIKEFAQSSQATMSNKQQELMMPLLEKVQKTIDAVAKENNFDFVLQNQAFLYSEEQFDITQMVIDKLKQ
ncbi:OmpH family outer membrane protein [Flexithrix dorotheae]|uniref:OmpH family outer membrane protein n=1 Tax=Flexithrix dorotheae TaxID=70993 RepID=UPI00036D143D|nr:OmpH family outer membrane protein [Flexithrix dorotheae]